MKSINVMTASLLIFAGTFAGSHAAPPTRLSEADARHVLVRTGFAPDHDEVRALTGSPATGAVAAIIKAAQTATSLHPAPGFVSQSPPIPLRLLKSTEERQAQRQQQEREGLEIKSWWMREMIETPAPLRERMTLFWHGHFASSLQKVNRSQAMWRQNQLLRGHALGNFRDLLHAVAKDPAMLVYLDGANSRKEAPNENFAREVMELFTLGETSQGGRYTEQDIKEAARAFTGWSVERDDFSFRFRPAFHDEGNKTIFGRSGNFDGDAALDILMEQPATARFIVSKLWKEFVSPAPDAVQVERIALRFRSSGYDIGTAVQELLLTDAFWAEANRGSLVKSPVDLVVGTVRQFDFLYSDATPFALKAAQLGQNLLVPPNVRGWPCHNDWVTATTLLERKRFTEQLFRAVELKGESPMTPLEMAAGRMMDSRQPDRPSRADRDGVMRVAQGIARVTFDPDQWLAQYGGHTDREPGEALKARLVPSLLPVPPTQSIASGTVGVAYLRALTLDPAYQLK